MHWKNPEECYVLLCVRFFFPGVFFLVRVTLIGSGVLVRTSSSTSYCGKDDTIREGVGAGVIVRGVAVCEGTTAPSGISPSRSIT
jgi:hypothetical protein